MADQKITMPTGMGGIVRYSEEHLSKIEFSPIFVIISILIVMVVELILYFAL